MNRKLMKAAALLLAAFLCGCSAPAPQIGGAPAAGGRMEVFDDDSGVASMSAYQREMPDIDFAGITSLSYAGSIDVSPDGSASGSSGKAAFSGEVRSVWITYLEMQSLLKNKSAGQFRQNIAKVFDNVAGYGLNTVVVQVRPFGDALYDSGYFPWSYTITGTEGKNPGYDPLQVMVEEARSRGLRIEAWVNPYRIRAAGNNNALSADNPAQKWLSSGSNSVIRYNGVLSYNPASKEAQQLIVNGIREIVRGYDVDGIHIDDYFYPSTDAAFDQGSYSAYKNGGGSLALADWRRQNVETLIRAIYKAVKEEDDSCTFGISPQSSVYNNYNAQYLDVEKIASTRGYCDYICPQIYFGFENDAQPFLQTLRQWDKMTSGSTVRLQVGIAAYKVGAADSWAGGGKNEWVENSDVLRRMVEAAREQTNYGGFVLYRYDSLFSPDASVKAAVQKEADNLKKLM